ncbi:MAG: V-type ATP synthase subunit F [Proteocatella sp.]
MKSFLISDNKDTMVAMRLSGISGVILHEKEEIINQIIEVLNDKEIGILILTEAVFETVQEEVMSIKLKRAYPLIVEIPDRFGQRREENYITRYINESVGVKL